jgi:phosphate transport system permease protein
MMTGAILAMSRAIGEAAPLLVLGGFLLVFRTPVNLMSDFTVLPLQIFNWASRPQETFHAIAASAIIVQLGLLLAFNAVAIFIRAKLQRPLQ